MLKFELTLRQLMELRGRPVYSGSGEAVGRLECVVVDDNAGERVWLGLQRGLFRRHTVLVPAGAATLREDGLRVPYPASVIEASPRMKAPVERVPAEIYRHYRLAVPAHHTRADVVPAATAVAPAVGARRAEMRVAPQGDEPNATPPAKAPARVGPRRPETWPAGAVTVARQVEEHEVRRRVAFEREVLVVRRERIDEPIEGIELAASELTITLFDHQPVVATHLVAKERISMEKRREHLKESANGGELAAEPAPLPQTAQFERRRHGNRKTA